MSRPYMRAFCIWAPFNKGVLYKGIQRRALVMACYVRAFWGSGAHVGLEARRRCAHGPTSPTDTIYFYRVYM